MIILRTTGIVRKIDELGRIVLPKELRKNLNIHTGDDFQILVEEEKIILEKYSRLINIETDIIKIINIFKNVYNYNIFIVYNNKFINGKENVPDKIIEIIHQRKIYKNEKITEVNLNGEKTTGKVIINPIVIDSDLLGAIIIIGNNIFDMESTSKIIKELIKKNL
mgnify:FL=1